MNSAEGVASSYTVCLLYARMVEWIGDDEGDRIPGMVSPGMVSPGIPGIPVSNMYEVSYVVCDATQWCDA